MTEDEELEQSMSMAVKVLQAIPKTGERGEIKCPRCEGGTVTWLRDTKRKRHLRAFCSTPACVRIVG
jgi:hypothetical protein